LSASEQRLRDASTNHAIAISPAPAITDTEDEETRHLQRAS
jgi:hypothetical protein